MRLQRVGHDLVNSLKQYTYYIVKLWCCQWRLLLQISVESSWAQNNIYLSLYLCICILKNQIASIPWIMEKAREFQKHIYFCFIDYREAFDCADHSKLWKILKEVAVYQTTLHVSWETHMWIKKQQKWTSNNRLVQNLGRSMTRL